MLSTLRLGTRGSPLAMRQAALVRDALLAAHGWPAEQVVIVPMSTVGDRVIDRPLAELGGKALWTKPLDRALEAGEIDLAVHSLKDVETVRPDTLVLAACLPRADPRDRLIGADSIGELAEGARVGTSSPRRAAQLRYLRPDLQIVGFRGNVATRLAKLRAGEADATLLAAAGLDRLDLTELGRAVAIETLLPACGQGIIAVESRSDDAALAGWLDAIDCPRTHQAALVERAFLAALTADCQSPVGAHARWNGELLTLAAQLLDEDGVEQVRGEVVVTASGQPAALAAALLDEASPRLRALFTR